MHSPYRPDSEPVMEKKTARPMEMSILDTVGWRMDPRKPYLMPHEVGHVRTMLEVGALSIFRMTRCAGCDGDVPICQDAGGRQLKTHCSRACYERNTKKPEDDDGEDGE